MGSESVEDTAQPFAMADIRSRKSCADLLALKRDSKFIGSRFARVSGDSIHDSSEIEAGSSSRIGWFRSIKEAFFIAMIARTT